MTGAEGSSMMSNLDRLVYMANQIARNLMAQGVDHAVKATADHIAKFWDPRMKAQIFQLAEKGDAALSPVALAAVDRLRADGAPASQSRATRFNAVDESSGRSDAG